MTLAAGAEFYENWELSDLPEHSSNLLYRHLKITPWNTSKKSARVS